MDSLQSKLSLLNKLVIEAENHLEDSVYINVSDSIIIYTYTYKRIKKFIIWDVDIVEGAYEFLIYNYSKDDYFVNVDIEVFNKVYNIMVAEINKIIQNDKQFYISYIDKSNNTEQILLKLV